MAESELIEKLKNIGLTESKAKETLKNVNLTNKNYSNTFKLNKKTCQKRISLNPQRVKG